MEEKIVLAVDKDGNEIKGTPLFATNAEYQKFRDEWHEELVPKLKALERLSVRFLP